MPSAVEYPSFRSFPYFNAYAGRARPPLSVASSQVCPLGADSAATEAVRPSAQPLTKGVGVFRVTLNMIGTQMGDHRYLADSWSFRGYRSAKESHRRLGR